MLEKNRKDIQPDLNINDIDKYKNQTSIALKEYKKLTHHVSEILTLFLSLIISPFIIYVIYTVLLQFDIDGFEIIESIIPWSHIRGKFGFALYIVVAVICWIFLYAFASVRAGRQNIKNAKKRIPTVAKLLLCHLNDRNFVEYRNLLSVEESFFDENEQLEIIKKLTSKLTHKQFIEKFYKDSVVQNFPEFNENAVKLILKDIGFHAAENNAASLVNILRKVCAEHKITPYSGLMYSAYSAFTAAHTFVEGVNEFYDEHSRKKEKILEVDGGYLKNLIDDAGSEGLFWLLLNTEKNESCLGIQINKKIKTIILEYIFSKFNGIEDFFQLLDNYVENNFYIYHIIENGIGEDLMFELGLHNDLKTVSFSINPQGRHK